MIRTKSLLALLFIMRCSDCLYGQEQQTMAMGTNSSQVDAMWGYKAPASYLILPRPANHFNTAQPHSYAQPRNPVESKPIQPYAYGWFGTKYSPQWNRQFGHQSAYTQWTLK